MLKTSWDLTVWKVAYFDYKFWLRTEPTVQRRAQKPSCPFVQKWDISGTQLVPKEATASDESILQLIKAGAVRGFDWVAYFRIWTCICWRYWCVVSWLVCNLISWFLIWLKKICYFINKLLSIHWRIHPFLYI